MNKKAIIILFICLTSLLMVSTVNAIDIDNNNLTSQSNSYHVTNEMSSDDIQVLIDNANEGDTFEFTSKEYRNVSLVVDNKLNIVSDVNSKIYTSDSVSGKARNLEIDKTFGFYFTSKSGGSILSGITIISDLSDYGVIVDSSDNTTIKNNVVTGGNKAGILVKNSD